MNSKETFLDLVGKKDFLKKIVELQDEKEVIKAFENEGVTPTEKEMGLLKSVLNKTCDELGKHSKEEIKEMKTMFDSLSEDQLLAVAGGVNDKNDEEPSQEEKNTADLVQAGVDALSEGKELFTSYTQYKKAEFDRDKTISEHTTQQRLSDNNTKTQQNWAYVAKVGIGTAAVLTSLYMFKDDIKSWFRGKK